MTKKILPRSIGLEATLRPPCDKTCGWNGVWSRSPGGEKKANTDTTRSALHISRPRGCRQAGERLPAIAPRPVPHRSISLLLRRFDARLREAKPTPHVKLFPSRRALLAPSGARAHHLVADGLDHEWVRGLIEAMAASSKPAPDRGDPEEDVGRRASRRPFSIMRSASALGERRKRLSWAKRGPDGVESAVFASFKR